MTLSLSCWLVPRSKSLPIAYKIEETSLFWIRARFSFLREISSAPIAGKYNIIVGVSPRTSDAYQQRDARSWTVSDGILSLPCATRVKRKDRRFLRASKLFPIAVAKLRTFHRGTKLKGGRLVRDDVQARSPLSKLVWEADAKGRLINL